MGQKGHPERAWAVAPPCRWPSAWILHGRYIFKKGWEHEWGGGPHLGEAEKLSHICPGRTSKNSHLLLPFLGHFPHWEGFAVRDRVSQICDPAPYPTWTSGGKRVWARSVEDWPCARYDL